MTFDKLHKFCIRCEVITKHLRTADCTECSTDWQWKSAVTYNGELPKYFKEKDDAKN